MFADIREAMYPPDLPIQDTLQFQEFQDAHAEHPGYAGTVIANVGGGRYVTVTLWAAESSMLAAREDLDRVAHRLLDPLMTKSPTAIGAGEVMYDDLP